MSKTYLSRYAAKKAARHLAEKLDLSYEVRDGFDQKERYWYPLFFCASAHDAAKAKEAGVEYALTRRV